MCRGPFCAQDAEELHLMFKRLYESISESVQCIIYATDHLFMYKQKVQLLPMTRAGNRLASIIMVLGFTLIFPDLKYDHALWV